MYIYLYIYICNIHIYLKDITSKSHDVKLFKVMKKKITEYYRRFQNKK